MRSNIYLYILYLIDGAHSLRIYRVTLLSIGIRLLDCLLDTDTHISKNIHTTIQKRLRVHLPKSIKLGSPDVKTSFSQHNTTTQSNATKPILSTTYRSIQQRSCHHQNLVRDPSITYFSFHKRYHKPWDRRWGISI